MIKFNKIEQKKWDILNGEDKVFDLGLISSTITNKYFIVTKFIENISEKIGKEFDDWFIGFLNGYVDVEDKFNFTMKNVPKIKEYVSRYIKEAELDFDRFVDESKTKKNSIFFNKDEIQKIIELSGYLKLYSVISNNLLLKLDQRRHKKIYNELTKEIMRDDDIIFKIFNIIKTKTFRYNMTDSYMWEYIKLIQCKSIDVHVIEIFNFIMNSILILCEENRNPITYFVSVVDESVKWFLRSVYKGSIIYDDSISTEDIHGLNIDNLKTYTYNDTLGRLKKIAYEKIYRRLEEEPLTFEEKDENVNITKFQNRISGIEFVSPLSECLIFPIVSKITEIPFNHFKTLSPEHSAIISAYMKDIFEEVFDKKYEGILNLLDYFPSSQPAVATTYKIKSINNFINIQDEIKNFYGFKTKLICHDVLSYFIGRISRVSFANLYDGQKLPGIPLSKIEGEMIEFFTFFFSGKLDNEIQRMRNIVLADF